MSEEDAFNPARITIMRDVGKIMKESKNLEEARKKWVKYILSMFGFEDQAT